MRSPASARPVPGSSTSRPASACRFIFRPHADDARPVRGTVSARHAAVSQPRRPTCRAPRAGGHASRIGRRSCYSGCGHVRLHPCRFVCVLTDLMGDRTGARQLPSSRRPLLRRGARCMQSERAEGSRGGAQIATSQGRLTPQTSLVSHAGLKILIRFVGLAYKNLLVFKYLC